MWPGSPLCSEITAGPEVERDDADFLVVGAGVVGLSAARALARRGRRVVVCERATVGNAQGGSKGSARIFRLGYDDPGYVRLAMVAHRLWRQWEDESGAPLLATTGQITFGDDLDVLVDALEGAGAPHQSMGADEVAERFPTMSVPGTVVYEPESGVLAADDCLAVLRRVDGVEVRERTRVVRLDDDGRDVRVVVETAGTVDELRVRGVVVCAGPWTGPVVADGDVGLRPLATLEQVAYLSPDATAGDGGVETMPVFVERRHPWFYGLPVASNGLMKVSLHGAGPAVSLDELDRADDRPDPGLVAALTAAARRVLPGLVPEPVATERCLYDNSPDGDFVVDRVGGIVIGSGTSGHGFKFAPLLGEMLADLATGAPFGTELGRPADLGRFRSGRLPSLADRAGPSVHP
jgi:sarcosine oxidase